MDYLTIINLKQAIYETKTSPNGSNSSVYSHHLHIIGAIGSISMPECYKVCHKTLIFMCL